MQNQQSKAVTLRARLNELPDLIEAAATQGNKEAVWVLRAERGDLEMSVPVLENQCDVLSDEALSAQIVESQEELVDAKATLWVAAQLNDTTAQEFEQQEHSPEAQTEAQAQVAVHKARHTVEKLRLKKANSSRP